MLYEYILVSGDPKSMKYLMSKCTSKNLKTSLYVEKLKINSH